MKQNLTKKLRLLGLGVCVCLAISTSIAWQQQQNNEPIIPGISGTSTASFATVDAETELLVPANKIYHRSEALELKKNLESQYVQNPNSLSVNYALVKYHACAPNFAGGFKGVALQHAANIYRINPYVGCMAYEYIYTHNNDAEHAKEWYKNSLACKLQDAMEWREVSYGKTVAFGIGVKGNFSNGKVQPLYQNIYGTYKRRIMMAKCAGDCEVTLVPDYMRGNNSNSNGRLIFTPF